MDPSWMQLFPIKEGKLTLSEEKIIQKLQNATPGEYVFTQIAPENERTILMYACQYGLTSVSHYLIDVLGNECMPQHKDKQNKTVLMYSIDYMPNSSVALKLINKFGNDCLPHIVSYNDEVYATAFLSACNRPFIDVANLMLDTFGKMCNLSISFKQGRGQDAISRLICRSSRLDATALPSLFDLIQRLITEFKDYCDIKHCSYAGYTALMTACEYKCEDIALLLIDKLGEDCMFEQQITYDKSEGTDPAYHVGNTARDIAVHNNMTRVVDALTHDFVYC